VGAGADGAGAAGGLAPGSGATGGLAPAGVAGFGNGWGVCAVSVTALAASRIAVSSRTPAIIGPPQ
jgi:hypothetical protein